MLINIFHNPTSSGKMLCSRPRFHIDSSAILLDESNFWETTLYGHAHVWRRRESCSVSVAAHPVVARQILHNFLFRTLELLYVYSSRNLKFRTIQTQKHRNSNRSTRSWTRLELTKKLGNCPWRITEKLFA